MSNKRLKYSLFALCLFLLFGCPAQEQEQTVKDNPTAEKTERSEQREQNAQEDASDDSVHLPLAIDKEWAAEMEKRGQELLNIRFLENPDTSVIGICIDNSQSTVDVLGADIKLGGDGRFKFLTKDKSKYLILNVHPGAYINQVSIFEVGYTDPSSREHNILHEYPLQTNRLNTEKGIELGIGRTELIAKLGDSYEIVNSQDSELTISYKIEMPQKTANNFLERYNMPIYFANYQFVDDRLNWFEFGFEYP